MEGSKTVISVDPWQEESLLIKLLASIHPEKEREKRKSPSPTSSPPSSQSPKCPPGTLGLKRKTPFIAGGPLTSRSFQPTLLIYYPITVKYGLTIIDGCCSPREEQPGHGPLTRSCEVQVCGLQEGPRVYAAELLHTRAREAPPTRVGVSSLPDQYSRLLGVKLSGLVNVF